MIRHPMQALQALHKYSRNAALTTIITLALCAIWSPLEAAMPSSAPVKIKMNVLFVLDSSGSMWAKLDGKPKLESARKVLNDVTSGLPPDTDVGLITYGHRRKGDCSDIELISPVGSHSANEIKSMVSGLKPKGMTPLADTLLWAADAFRKTEGGKMIVLITDGGEECGGDPCAVARQLAASGLVVRVNVVGLILSGKEREQLQCIAQEGGGRYFDVTDKETLYKATSAIHKEVETFPPPVEVTPPPPPVKRAPAAAPNLTPKALPAPPPESTPSANDVNLLLPSEGGTIINAPNLRWNAIVTGKDRASTWTWDDQEAVFGFKDGKAARFSRFAIAIPATIPQNVNEFELFASKDSPDGPFNSLGQFATHNRLGDSLYQEFTFRETTAKYFKFKALSNYGYSMQSWGNTQLFQIRLMGTIQ